MRDSLAKGSRPALACLAAGALSALALAPFYLWPLLFLSIPLLLSALDSAPSARAAFRRGWCWGFGFFIAGLYWIVIALTVDMARFGWMIPFALVGMNAALALFFGAVGWLWHRLRRGRAVLDWALFVALFCVAEWLRGHVLTGFPWNLPGYAWGATDTSLQAASVLGAYGLTFLTVALCASVWLLNGAQKKAGRVIFAVLLAACAGLLMHGHLRLQSADASTEGGPRVRLVQANIPQSLKWNPDFTQRALEKHIALSKMPADGALPDLIIWPETSFPYALSPESEWPARLAAEVLSPKQMLMTGAVLSDRTGVYNGMVAIDAEGKVVASHAKHHLVPFGEYVPLRRHLPGIISKITPGDTDFARGRRLKNPVSLSETLFVLPLICYEVIFPEYSFASDRRGFLVNLTNDGWYGVSTGPFQHLDMARFRAAEQGMPMVRVAGTGISAAYDGYGRRLGSIGLHEEGVLDISLPPPLSERTVYNRLASGL